MKGTYYEWRGRRFNSKNEAIAYIEREKEREKVKLQVGDRVRVVDEHKLIWKGEIYTVTEISTIGTVKLNKYPDKYWNQYRFELAPLDAEYLDKELFEI